MLVPYFEREPHSAEGWVHDCWLQLLVGCLFVTLGSLRNHYWTIVNHSSTTNLPSLTAVGLLVLLVAFSSSFHHHGSSLLRVWIQNFGWGWFPVLHHYWLLGQEAIRTSSWARLRDLRLSSSHCRWLTRRWYSFCQVFSHMFFFVPLFAIAHPWWVAHPRQLWNEWRGGRTCWPYQPFAPDSR